MTLPTQMNAMTVQKYGKHPVQKTSVPTPTIGDDDVLVKVHSASVNPLDFKIRNGDLKLVLPFKMPLILGNDFAGTVVGVGKNVREFAVGDAVFARTDTLRIGSFGEFVAIDQSNLAKKPTNLDFNESASLPLVALTAYQAFKKNEHQTLIACGCCDIQAQNFGDLNGDTAKPARPCVNKHFVACFGIGQIAGG